MGKNKSTTNTNCTLATSPFVSGVALPTEPSGMLTPYDMHNGALRSQAERCCKNHLAPEHAPPDKRSLGAFASRETAGTENPRRFAKRIGSARVPDYDWNPKGGRQVLIVFLACTTRSEAGSPSLWARGCRAQTPSRGSHWSRPTAGAWWGCCFCCGSPPRPPRWSPTTRAPAPAPADSAR